MPVAHSAWSPLELTPRNPAGYGPSGSPDADAVSQPAGRKVLLVDDDPDFLDTYRKVLSDLPSHPDIHTATSAARAFALLEAEPFAVMITDLRMPKVDGFQIILSARRRFPSLRTVVVTGLSDHQYRARAYAAGIDLYTEKPTTVAEIRLFGECVEALLAQGEQERGFRGLQNKSLMDLLQIECLSQHSTLLRISRGALEGRIWMDRGEIIDAELQELRGAAAFQGIFAWKTGNFEILPCEPGRARTIHISYESLLLESAHTLDEAAAADQETPAAGTPRLHPALAPLGSVRGVESLLLVEGGDTAHPHAWGVENPAQFAAWVHQLLGDFQRLGQMLEAGPLAGLQALGPVRAAVVLAHQDKEVMAGLHRKLGVREVRAAAREIATHLGKT